MKNFIRRHYILFGFLVLAVLFLVFCAPWVPSNAETVVRNSVFTQELADQCADTAHYDCQLVKSAPEERCDDAIHEMVDDHKVIRFRICIHDASDEPAPQRRFPHLQGRQ